MLCCFLSTEGLAQNGYVKPVLIAPFPISQADLTYTLNNRGGRRDPFNPNPEEYRMMGNYRVKGNSMLLRGSNATDVFMSQGYAKNVNVVYDTYNQNFSVLVDNNSQMLHINFSDLDSFRVNKDTAGLTSLPATFINASRIDKSKKFFVQRLVSGKRYILFKSYKSEMVPSSGDIAQTNLQAFEMTNDYYVLDMTDLNKGFRKVKGNKNTLRSELKGNAAALAILENASFNDENKEMDLVRFFSQIN